MHTFVGGKAPEKNNILRSKAAQNKEVFKGLSPFESHRKSGFTLIEIMIVLGLTSLIMSLFAPTYHGIKKSWTQSNSASQMRQGGLVGTEFMNSHLRQSQGVISISEPDDPNGFVSFLNQNGQIEAFSLYDYNGQTALGWQVNGVMSPVTVPVAALYLSAKDKDGNATTTPALVQSFTMTLTISDPNGEVPNQDFHTTVKIRKDVVSALNYVCFASGNITLTGSGTVSGDIHANGSISLSTVSLTGTATSGTTEPLPDPNLLGYQNKILPVASYRPYATTVITGNYTFHQNNTYNGIYYIAGGGNGIIEKNVNINGAVYAEGDLIIDGQNVTVIGSGSIPALVASRDIIVSNFQDHHFRVTGTAYAHRDITLPGKDAIMTAGAASPLAMGAGRDFIFSGFDFTAYGTLLAGRNMTFTSYNKNVEILANAQNPAVLVGGALSINSRDMRISGLIWSAGDSQLLSDDFDFDGVLISGGNITGSKPISLRYMGSLLSTPPPYMTGDTL